MCSLSIEIEVFGRSLLVQDQVSSLCSSFDVLCLHEGAVQSLILWFQMTSPVPASHSSLDKEWFI